MFDVPNGPEKFNAVWPQTPPVDLHGVTHEGNVHVPPFQAEPLNRLMHGVVYGGDYLKMTDYSKPTVNTPQKNAEAYYAALSNNQSHGGSNSMTIDLGLFEGDIK